jgi:DNA-binding response OmpR family regulator
LEGKLLEYFRLNAGKDLSRDTLARDVWGLKLDPRSRCIDQTVAELRRHLHDGDRIVTVYCFGYRYEKAGRRAN